MRIIIISLCLSLKVLTSSAGVPDTKDPTLTTAVKEYQLLQKELDKYLKNKTPACSPDGKVAIANYCSLRDLCSNPEVQSDSSYIYQNKNGEKIVNDNYYAVRDGIKACLKEKYSDEIAEKRTKLASKLEYQHLNKIMDANKKLSILTNKFNEGAKIQKISSEILTMTLQSELKHEASDWSDDFPSREDLNAFIKRAEKRTKTTLNPEIVKTLVEIQYLKKNPLYLEQVDKFEEELIPDMANTDALFNWKLLTNEKAAGGADALKNNRAKLTQKTQEGYAVFQETQKEILDYLDSKKNEINADKIDRIIERVKTIRFNPPRLTKTLTRNCVVPNAFYIAATHSLTICPQMLTYPKMAIMETMAHEIAHSFDSCNLSGKFYQIKGPSVVEEAPFEVDITTNSNGNFSNTRSEDPKNLDLKNRLQDKLSYADNPFSKTLSCLQDPLSVGAKPVRLDEMRVKTHEKLAELTRLGQNNSNNAMARALNYISEHEVEYFNYFQGCDSNDSATVLGSQMQEAFADKISSEIMARKFKGLSQQDAEKSFLQITLAYGQHICGNEARGETKLREFAVKEGCPDYGENMTNEARILNDVTAVDPRFDSHPDAPVRIERNHLAHPDIRKALNCPENSGVKYCE